jgi:hypothetical protein
MHVRQERYASEGQSLSKFYLIAALLVLTTGLTLRVYHLGLRSLWYDEAVTANISRGAVTQILDQTRLRSSAPIVHPYILYLAEEFAKGPVAARAPSALASFLAILIVLALVRAKVSYTAALFSAAILAVSASQIRYAQEVREYSLSVLFSTLLIFCLLHWESKSADRHPIGLYVCLFLAPFIQYGLVFLAFGVLCTIGFRLLFTRGTTLKWSYAMIASGFLAAGSLLSYGLTLRFQLHPGGVWYLQEYYFDPKAASLPRFLIATTRGLQNFFFPAQVMTACFLVGVVIFCFLQARARKVETITVLALSTMLTTICASLVRKYPYGGVRQCLFLAAPLALFAGTIFGDLVNRVGAPLRRAVVTSGCLLAILLLGFRGIQKVQPYAEYEDTLSILGELRKSSVPNDQVWVNHDAAEALIFYLGKEDSRFIFGKYHSNPQEYIQELLGAINPRHRLWLVFSHLQQPSDRAEEQLIIASLQATWDVREVISPTNTALFLADPRPAPLGVNLPSGDRHSLRLSYNLALLMK